MARRRYQPVENEVKSCRVLVVQVQYDQAYTDFKSEIDSAVSRFDERVRKILEMSVPVSEVLRTVEPKIVTRTPVDISVGVRLGPCARKLLEVLATWWPKHLSSSFLAVFTGYSMKSGGFATALSQLRKSGLIEGPNDRLNASEAGLEAIPPSARVKPPRGEKLLEMWTTKLSPCPASILMCLYDRYPEQISADEVARLTKYSAKSGGFASSLSELRTLALIAGSNKNLMLHNAFAKDSR